MRLFKKLVLILLAVGCLPLAIASWFLLQTNAEALRTAIFERQREQASSLARTLNIALSQISDALDNHSRQNDLAKLSEAERDEQARRLLGRHREDLNVVSMWREGESSPLAIAYFRASANDGGSHVVEGHMSAVAKTRPDASRPVFSEPYLGPDGDACVTILVPARTADDGSWTLAAEVRLARVQEEVDGTRVGPRGEVMIVDGKGRVVLARDRAIARARADLSGDELVTLAAVGQLSGSREYSTDGNEMLGAFARARVIGWTTLVREPSAVALAPARRMLRQTVLVAVATMLGAILGGVYFARGIATPLQKVVSASLSIARGRFGQRLDVERRDEVGELAHTFNYMSQQLATYDGENKKLFNDLQRGYLETIRALANSIDAKDPYTRGHSQRVTEYSVEVARELGLDDEEVARIQFGAILHDIGKIGIKEKILGKNAPLTDDEYEYMKTHPLLGVGIVDPIEFLDPVKPIIRHHHERWDGKGYPDALSGDQIDIGARIVSITDAWDAMVTQRPYNVPMTYEQGVARLKQIAGTQHDPKVTDAFLRVLVKRREEELAGDEWRNQQSNVVELPKRSS